MDRRRSTRVALVGAAAVSLAACAQQQPNLAAVSHSNTFAYTAADRECLARAMYFESNRSSSDGMLAVGSIIANRVQSGRYGSTVCQVVGAKLQFAPGVMTRTMSGSSADLARSTADQVLSGKRHPGVKSAMHFHTAGMRFRYPNMHYVLVAGGNAFYEKRDSSGGGRAANERSLALALAYAKAADPSGQAKSIEVAAATPLEAPIPAAVSYVPVTVKSGTPAVAVVTQVASVKPAPVPTARPIVVASAAPVAAGRAVVAQAVQVAAVRPSVAQPVQIAAAQPIAGQRLARVVAAKPAQPVAESVAYAQADAPVVSLPKIRPAPKRVISVQSAEPALASIAPVSKSRKSASPNPATEVAQTPAWTPAPQAQSVEAASAGNPQATNHVASAFAAFD